MAIDIEDLDQCCRLALSEPITVNSAAELRETLARALDLKKPVEIDLQQVSEIDVAGIQLLYAAVQAADASGVPVSIAGTVPAVVASSFVECGLNPFEHCSGTEL